MKAMFLIVILIVCIPNYDVNAQKIAERSIFSDNGNTR